jgi:hypothetical protein
MCGSRLARENEVRRCVGKRSVGGCSGVLLGNLTEIVLSDGRMASARNIKGLHLAWMPQQKELAIVKKVQAKAGSLSSTAKRIHKQFHQVAPTKAAAYEWPKSNSRQIQEGLIRSITYVVPASVKSPGKRGYRWVHAFGDHGESGHGPVGREKTYPEKLMPALTSDAQGNLFIRRRPGNKYRVSEWIYW